MNPATGLIILAGLGSREALLADLGARDLLLVDAEPSTPLRREENDAIDLLLAAEKRERKARRRAWLAHGVKS